ncbi:SAC3/GANP/THP3 like protein, partial [Aduncisulcus paluster]
TSISVTDSKRGMGLFGVIPQDSDPTHSIFSSVVSDGASSSMFGSIFGTETEKEEKSTTSQSFTNSDTEYSRIFPSSSASAVIPQPTNDSTISDSKKEESEETPKQRRDRRIVDSDTEMAEWMKMRSQKKLAKEKLAKEKLESNGPEYIDTKSKDSADISKSLIVNVMDSDEREVSVVQETSKPKVTISKPIRHDKKVFIVQSSRKDLESTTSIGMSPKPLSSALNIFEDTVKEAKNDSIPISDKSVEKSIITNSLEKEGEEQKSVQYIDIFKTTVMKEKSFESIPLSDSSQELKVASFSLSKNRNIGSEDNLKHVTDLFLEYIILNRIKRRFYYLKNERDIRIHEKAVLDDLLCFEEDLSEDSCDEKFPLFPPKSTESLSFPDQYFFVEDKDPKYLPRSSLFAFPAIFPQFSPISGLEEERTGEIEGVSSPSVFDSISSITHSPYPGRVDQASLIIHELQEESLPLSHERSKRRYSDYNVKYSIHSRESKAFTELLRGKVSGFKL